jgi:periplasmic protein TonB
MAQYLLQTHMMKAFRRNKQPIKSLDDIVFENRNKEYGCYDLRITYKRRLLFSFTFVLFIFLFATSIIYFWKINPLFDSSNKTDNTYFESVQYSPDLLPLIMQIPSIPKEKQVALANSTEQNNINEQQKRINYKTLIPLEKPKPVIPVADTLPDKLAEDLLKRHKDNLKKEISILTDTVKFVLEKAPQFPGGNAAMQAYFYRNQHYPANAILTGKQGSAIVSIIVNEKGMVEHAKVVSGIDPELDMEAIRLVQTMPLWQPAIYKGKPIACMLIIPVDFAIR